MQLKRAREDLGHTACLLAGTDTTYPVCVVVVLALGPCSRPAAAIVVCVLC